MKWNHPEFLMEVIRRLISISSLDFFSEMKKKALERHCLIYKILRILVCQKQNYKGEKKKKILPLCFNLLPHLIPEPNGLAVLRTLL